MGTGRLLIILLIGYILTSCTKEVVTVIDIPKEKASTISLQIALGSGTGTRSDDWGYEDYFPSPTPTPEERKVSNILVVIFKNIFLEEYAMYETEGPNEDFTYDESTGIITLHKAEAGENEIDLEPGVHYFYAFLNIPDELFLQIKPLLDSGVSNLTQETFEKQIMDVNFGYLKGEDPTGKGFIMTNSNTPSSQYIYPEDECDEESGKNNTVQIKVGRALSKVSLAYVPAKTGELHGSLSNIYYKTVNHPSRMYLIPVIENNTLITPHYETSSSAGFIYPVKDVLDDPRAWLHVTTTPARDNADFDYCIENSVKNT